MALTLLLTVLKIIGIIFLCIITLILFVMALVLFVPFCYKVRAEKYETINGRFTLSWLFGIIRVIYGFDNTKDRFCCVKLLGIKVWSEKTNVEHKDEKNEDARVEDIKRSPEPSTEPSPELSRENSSDYTVSNQAQECSDKRFEDIKHQEPQEKQEQPYKNVHTERVNESPRKKKKVKAKKSKQSKNNEQGTLKKLWQYENKSAVLKQVLLLLKRLFKIVTNVKVWADIKFGTGQPHTTGYILALCSAFTGYTGLNINAEGDYEYALLKGEINVKGRIFICSFVWVILLFIFNKSIFPIIKKIIFRKDEASV